MRKHLNIILPTVDEDEAINRGIAEDPDTYELSREEIKGMRWMRAQAQLSDSENEVTGTPSVDSDIINAFKAMGTDWQTLMNNVLRTWLKRHHLLA